MMIGVPLMQLILFGYAINADPQASADRRCWSPTSGLFARTPGARRSQNTGYFEVVRQATSEAEADELLARGDVLFVINIPAGLLAASSMRGEQPAVLVEADATDPIATGNALRGARAERAPCSMHDLKGPLASLAAASRRSRCACIAATIPKALTEFNIVPGLIGMILTMTMVMMTAIAITRERERGTMENLLAMPVRPIEVMLGKIIPYRRGRLRADRADPARRQAPVRRAGAAARFRCCSLALVLFIAANLAMGFTFSTHGGEPDAGACR